MRKFFTLLRPEEWFLVILASLLGGFAALNVYTLGLSKAMTDGVANTVHSRLILDSLTPGITQTGMLWHPLMPLLLLPFVQIPFLLRTGLSGAVAIMPLYVVATIIINRLGMELTDRNRVASVTAATVFASNPYVLYYASISMSDVVFISFFSCTVYFALRWLRTNRITILVYSGFFASLCALTRSEGILLVGILGGVIVLLMLLQRFPYQQMEAMLTIFLFWGLFGSLFYVIVGWIFFSDPLAIIHGQIYLPSQPGADSSAANMFAQYNCTLSGAATLYRLLQISLHASYYLYGMSIVWLAGGGIVALILTSRHRFESLLVLVLLLGPLFIFLFFLMRGMLPFGVPDFPLRWFWCFGHKLGRYYETRYVLMWAVLIYASLCVLINTAFHVFQSWSRSLAWITQWVLVAIILFIAFSQTIFVMVIDQYKTVIRHEIQYHSSSYSLADVAAFERLYDFGKIFLIKKNNEFFYVNTHISTSDYIWEGNYQFYQETIQMPWLFVRWFIVGSTEAPKLATVTQAPAFLRYYSLIDRTSTFSFYRLNEALVREDAELNGLRLDQIPSLNPTMEWWDPETNLQNMGLRCAGDFLVHIASNKCEYFMAVDSQLQ